MSEIFEIAYAAATNRLCLFTGTGFSKAITENQAPSWQGLLESLCEHLPKADELKKSLFPESLLSMEEIAQVISIKLNALEINIHEEAAKLVENIKLSGANKEIEKFFSERRFRVVTTNYDKLAEQLAGENDCQSIAPGLPIPRSTANIKIYHVHGSIDSPENMILTSEDYFKFINGDSYFSRKLSTVLHENTVVILGYSLGDTNLKAIISDYRGFSKTHVIGSNIFLISRSRVDQHIKDYYSHCYGIRVIDKMGIHEFFENLNKSIPKVDEIAKQSIANIRKVVYEGAKFKKEFLKLEDSFYRIISSLSAEGLSLKNARVVSVLGEIIDTKRGLTQADGAWEQYEQLARWLTYFASIFEIRNTAIEDIYLRAVLRSMKTMSNRLIIGYSWHAYKAWKSRWPSIISSNRDLIKKYIGDQAAGPDAMSVVNSL